MSATVIKRLAGAIPPDTDLGDEREVERELIKAGFWADDIAELLGLVIERARALRILDLEFSTTTIG